MGDINRKDNERFQKILQAAARVFEREGINGASMRVIAKEAEVTTGAIYALFDGKEDLYACLLEDSLDRLYTAVAKSTVQYPDALDALIVAGRAFYEYYEANPFEANLGIYLYGMGRVRGVGDERDIQLNQSLLQTLNIFRACFIRLAPPAIAESDKQQWAEHERDVMFAMLLGLLTMQLTGRDKSIGTETHLILDTYINGLRQRFS